METTSLGLMCFLAFVVVFLVLAVLAAAMHLTTVLFPERQPSLDAATVAAISSAVVTTVPGARVVRIEEES